MKKLLLSLVFCTSLFAADKTPVLANLLFTDGKQHTIEDFKDKPIYLYYFCGKCPTAMNSLGKEGKNLVDEIEREGINATVIFITSDKKTSSLIGLQQTKRLEKALFAYDPKNIKNISTKNILQYDLMINGKAKYIKPTSVIAKLKEFKATPAIAVEGIESKPCKTILSYLEQNKKDAVKLLLKACKNKKTKEEANKIKEFLTASIIGDFEKFKDAVPTMNDYEMLEKSLIKYKSLKLKDQIKQIKKFAKLDNIKAELDIRKKYTKLYQAYKKDQSEKVIKAFQKFSEKYSESKYGELAARIANSF